jgi:CRISPR/Cas system type I-B associated protein Csh2 (Cas7 group RAMP superfamily)
MVSLFRRQKGGTMTVISIPKILRERLTDEGAEAFVQILDKVEDRTQKAVFEVVEERFEKRIAQLETKIESSKAEVIKWMFIFWVGQVGVTMGILFAFFRK